MGDKELSVEDIKKLASLPSMEEIRAKILGLLVSTQTNLVCALTGNQSNILRVINNKFRN
jgi:ribosomal protein L10